MWVWASSSESPPMSAAMRSSHGVSTSSTGTIDADVTGRRGRYVFSMQVRRVRVQVETERLRITGTLQLPTEGYRSRSTDYLSANEQGFIALTNAQIVPADGGEPTDHRFVAVGARHIATLVEVEDLGVTEEEPKIGAISTTTLDST